MKKNEIITKVSSTFGRVGLKLKKHSPEILVVAGVVGTVASAVIACKATTKIDSVLDETKKKVDKIHDGVEKGYIENTETQQRVEYYQVDGKKYFTNVYTQTALKFAKLYAPAVVLGALSITSIVASNNILRKRNVAIAATYAAVNKGFKEYRGRVIERFGEQVDHELKHNIKSETVTEIVVDEDGNEKAVERNVVTADSGDEYSCVFDETSPAFDRNYADANDFFLSAEQNYANDLLRARGHLFLNEVRDRLGLPRTPAGQVVGWVYKPDDKNYKGDNFVDFGIRKMDPINEDDTSPVPIFLDFNVDGVVYDLI